MTTDTLQPAPTTVPRPAGRALRVLAADGDPAAREFYRQTLPALGHEVCLAETGHQLRELFRSLAPDLVITADRLPDAAGADVAAAVGRERPVPVVLVSAAPDPATVWAAADGHVFGYVVKPLRPDAVGAAVAVAARSFERVAAARAEAAELRQALEDRKVIERAKGAVVRYCGVGEDEAYRRLRKLATVGGRKLVDVARTVLAAAEVFGQLAEDALPTLDGSPRRTAVGDGRR